MELELIHQHPQKMKFKHPCFFSTVRSAEHGAGRKTIWITSLLRVLSVLP